MDTESNPASSPEPEAPKSSRSTVVIHPALDIGRKAAFVGIVDHSKKPWVIGYEPTPKAVRYDAGTLTKSGRLVPPPFAYEPLRGRWPESDLEAFLAQPAAPELSELVPIVRQILCHYVEFARPEDATLCACWIVGTYVHQAFRAFPRLNLHGERGSGKSKLLEIIAALAFNGLLLIDPTPAVLFRLIGPLRPTLCLDEMEGLDGSDDKAIYSILNAGYKAGATVARIEGDASNRRPVGFEVYGPVAFGSITGLNTTTADRSITIHMVRGGDMATINRSVDARDSSFGAIRASLYRSALVWGSRIRNQPVSELVPPFIMGRPRELFLPLLVIAELAGGSALRDDLLRVHKQSLMSVSHCPRKGGRFSMCFKGG